MNTNGYTKTELATVTDSQLTSYSISYSNNGNSGEYYYHINYVLNQPSTYYSF